MVATVVVEATVVVVAAGASRSFNLRGQRHKGNRGGVTNVDSIERCMKAIETVHTCTLKGCS